MVYLHKLDVVFTVAAGNDADIKRGKNLFVNTIPQTFATTNGYSIYPVTSDERADLTDLKATLILVGATNPRGEAARWSQFGPDVQIHAPGEQVYLAFPGGQIKPGDGTSFCKTHPRCDGRNCNEANVMRSRSPRCRVGGVLASVAQQPPVSRPSTETEEAFRSKEAHPSHAAPARHRLH